MYKKLNAKFYLVAFIIPTILIAGCYNYYKTKRGTDATALKSEQTIDSLKREGRYFILRSGDEAWHMKAVSLSEDRKTLSCTLDSVSYQHKLHFSKGFKGAMRYKKSKPEHIQVLNEIHLFIPEEHGISAGPYTLSLEKVHKVEVLEKDKKRTTNSYVLGAIGYTLGTIALVGVVVAATKSSCPFVSAYDGHEFSLQGEIYGGAIYPQLARHDYMPLKMAPLKDGSLQVKISNELQERQYTDIAELWVVSHPRNQQVVVDQYGSLYSISDPQTPFSATLNNREDVLPAINKPDDYKMIYMHDTSQKNAGNDVVLKFTRKNAAIRAKLLLSLKNSYWLDYLYGKLAEGFGSYYMTYIKEQQSKPAAELQSWIKQQQIPLTVSLKTKNGWKEIENITTVGPLATREMVVPVDLSGRLDSIVELKLSSGFMFWEIDYATIDFTPDHGIVVQKLLPKRATDEKGRNVLQFLMKEDGSYLSQPNIGDVASISYKPNRRTHATAAQTYILHTKGYYEHVRNFKNDPDLLFLSQFKKPDAFPVYGMKLYKQFSAESLRALSSKN